MSVAIGIPQPRSPAPPALSVRYSSAGTSMPPIAPAIANPALRGEDSSPTSSSRLISRPTSRKNSTINPSLIQWSSDLESAAPSGPMVHFVSQSARYVSPQGELAQTSAITALSSSRVPLAASV